MTVPEPIRAARGAAAARPDGRHERHRITHERVVSALVALVEEGHARPSAQRVAARAGVSVRTVHHHFEDVEALRAEALATSWRRHSSALAGVEPGAPLGDRITAVVGQLRRLYEGVAPMCREAARSNGSQTVADESRQERRTVRRFVADAFEGEIRAAGIAGPVLLDALDVALSWQNWHYLRSELGRGPAKAARTVELVVRNLFLSAAD